MKNFLKISFAILGALIIANEMLGNPLLTYLTK